MYYRANQYEQITDVSVSPLSSSSAAAAARAVSNTSTTLVDNNRLYEESPQPVTSSNVAEADCDITDFTVIDNDLYERQQQLNCGSYDYELTLIDNDFYR